MGKTPPPKCLLPTHFFSLPKLEETFKHVLYLSAMPFFLYFFLFFSVLFSCADDDGVSSISYFEDVPDDPVSEYVVETNNALTAWMIGLETSTKGAFRNVNPDYQANPPNWITVASQTDCNALGIPFDLRQNGAGCILDEDVVGVCYIRSYIEGPNAGQILDTTILIEKEELARLSDMDENDQIKALLTHEIGHCLGLQHWGKISEEDSDEEPGNPTNHRSHIMYPMLISGHNSPKAEEIEAIEAIYDDPSGCGSTRPDEDCKSPGDLMNADNCGRLTSASNHTAYEAYVPCYYADGSKEGSPVHRIYQPHFPTFHISASIGNAGIRGEFLPPGPPIEGKISIHVYKMKADGKESISRISEGKKR